MKQLIKISWVLMLLLSCCANPKDHIITEKDIIPEGTAFDPGTNTIYIGSIYKQKIIGIRPDGTIEDVISQQAFGDLSPIGMEVDEQRNSLWVNTGRAPIVDHQGVYERKTTIFSFDLTDHSLIKQYDFIEEEGAFLNDLTVAQDGTVYATESANSRIYKIDPATDQLVPFIELVDFGFPNGIAYYEPQHCLFVATNEGIVKVDIQSKQYALLAGAEGIDVTTIDGLTIHQNYFIGHQSSKISKFYFDEGLTTITHYELFDSGEEFDSSTTGEVGNGAYHYIVNSQLRSGINRDIDQVKPLDSLENVIIRTKRL